MVIMLAQPVPLISVRVALFVIGSFFKVLIILQIIPVTGPIPSAIGKQLVNQAVPGNFSRVGLASVDKFERVRRQNLLSLDVRINPGVNINRPTITVLGIHTRLARQIPTIKGTGIIRRHGDVILPLKRVHQFHALYLKSVPVQGFENVYQLFGQFPVDNQGAVMGLVIKSPMGNSHIT